MRRKKMVGRERRWDLRRLRRGEREGGRRRAEEIYSKEEKVG